MSRKTPKKHSAKKFLFVFDAGKQSKSFDYTSHERLKEAIEKKLFADLKDIIKVTTSVSHPDQEQLRRINDVTDRLVRQHGYCPVCANEIVRYVGSLLNR